MKLSGRTVAFVFTISPENHFDDAGVKLTSTIILNDHDFSLKWKCFIIVAFMMSLSISWTLLYVFPYVLILR